MDFQGWRPGSDNVQSVTLGKLLNLAELSFFHLLKVGR